MEVGKIWSKLGRLVVTRWDEELAFVENWTLGPSLRATSEVWQPDNHQPYYMYCTGVNERYSHTRQPPIRNPLRTNNWGHRRNDLSAHTWIVKLGGCQCWRQEKAPCHSLLDLKRFPPLCLRQTKASTNTIHVRLLMNVDVQKGHPQEHWCGSCVLQVCI